jgi:molybdopterin-containing oxidoreductase family iron-sulfur binding subunit
VSEAKKKYWKSLPERDGDPEFLRAAEDEFAGELPVPAVQTTRRGLAEFVTRPLPSPIKADVKSLAPAAGKHQLGLSSSRRDFLKATGFTFALATAAGCSRAPLEKAIPLLNQPEQLVPGRSLFYATTCGGCSAGCGVLAKVRDGRPVKLEGNPQHALSQGGLCAAGQASILGLYDSQRLTNPRKGGSEATWEVVDREITEKLEAIRTHGDAVRFLTGTITSPTLRAEIAEFLKTFPDARQVQYDAISHSAILDAHERTHGVRVLPSYRFDRAEVVASFDADFLGTWISPVQFTADYRQARDLEARPPRFSYHVQFEPRMSVTGSKADRRLAVAPHETGVLLSALAARLAKKAGVTFRSESQVAPVAEPVLNDLSDRLWSARGKSLVVSGSNDVREQVLVNFINHLLGDYGKTLDIERPSLQAQGDDRELEKLLRELRAGKVQALFVHGANPAYDLPGATAALKNVPLLVTFAERADETASLAHYVCPDRHYLESWADAEPVAGHISVTQPAIRPLANTRPGADAASLPTTSSASPGKLESIPAKPNR